VEAAAVEEDADDDVVLGPAEVDVAFLDC